jgi:hypothetical protein
MRRGTGIAIGVTLLAIVAAVAIGAGMYHVGYTNGLEANGSVEVIREVGGYGRWGGGFPFGFLLFPLFLIGIVLLVRGAFWRGGGWGHEHAPMGSGGWRREMAEDWHRRQHEGRPDAPGSAAGSAPSG